MPTVEEYFKKAEELTAAAESTYPRSGDARKKLFEQADHMRKMAETALRMEGNGA